MRKQTQAPLRVDWNNCFSPAVSWVWLLETYCIAYYNGGHHEARRYLVPY